MTSHNGNGAGSLGGPTIVAPLERPTAYTPSASARPLFTNTPFSAARPSAAMLERIAAFEQARRITVPRWEPVRAIVQNYFVSPYQEFHFVNGCLVLGGGNGTGKTSLLTAFLTLVLDNDKRPERLDPGGSRDRSIAYYVLGETDKQFFHRNRTAYVALEFRHTGSGAFRTIGIGLQGVRAGGDGQPRVESWGFLLADGRRIGVDLQLFAEEGGKRIPLSQARLMKELGADTSTVNRVVEGVAEYQELVNAALFGFRTPQQYRDLLDILTELRASKLDNNIRPTTVNGLLQRSLQPLDPALMEEAGRVYERIDHFQDKLDLLQAQVTVLDDLHKAEGVWRRAAARREAALFHEAHAEAGKAARRLEKLKADIARERAAVVAAEQELTTARETRAVKQGRLGQLMDRDELKDVGKLTVVQDRLTDAQRVAAHAMEVATVARSRHEDARTAAAQLLEVWHGVVDAALAQARDLEEAARLAWPTAVSYAEAVATAARSGKLTRTVVQPLVTISSVRADYEVRRDALQDITRAIRSLEHAEGIHTQAVERQAVLAKDLREASEHHDRARTAEADGRARLADALRTWADGVSPEVPIAPVVLEASLAAALNPETEPAAITEPLMTALADADAAAREEVAARRARVVEAERVVSDASERLEAKQQERDEAPTVRPSVARARIAVAAAGVAVDPLYRAVDFAPDVPPAVAAQLESILEDSGLLNALVVAPEDATRVRAALVPTDPGADPAADTWLLCASEGPSSRARPNRGAPHTLQAYLRPVADGPVADTVVRAALGAVAVVPTMEDLADVRSHAATGLALDGGWVHGALAGATTSRPGEARYIGAVNRQRTREAAIRALEAEVAAAREGRDIATAAWEDAKGRVNAISGHRRALSQLPALRSLAALIAEVRSAEREVNKWESRESAARQEVAAARTRVTRAKEALDQACQAADWSEPRTADAVDARIRILEKLRRDVDALEQLVAGCARALSDQARVAATVTPLAEEAAGADAHAADQRRAVMKVEAEVQAIKDLLERPDIKELRREVEELRFSLGNLADVIEEHTTARDKAEARLQQNEESLEEREAAALATAQRAAHAYDALLNALEVHTETLAEAASARQSAEAAADVAETLLQGLGAKEREPTALEAAREGAFGTMDAIRRDHTAVLNSLQPHVDRRAGCTFVHHGRQLPTHLLLEELRDDQRKLDEELSEHHRTLMQRFLSQDILSAIHAAIKQTKDLIDLVNDKLAHLKTSKGRQLRFVWTPVRLPGSATSVADVAKLLETRVAYLSDEDRETLVQFIQERLTYVRATVKRGDAALGYVEALKQALDYRHWYQFSMQAFEKRWVEFTDRKFGTGSNGEKAVDMLAPLFAVVHARYANAAPDAPRLLGMDEAFAGVDATNTKAMFGLLRDFEFAFVMTSEKLWGVSENLPGCATYQLQVDDPKDPSTLAATLFLWDGARRLEDAPTGQPGRPGRSAGTNGSGGQGELVL